MADNRHGLRGKLPWLILFSFLVACVVIGGVVHQNYLWQRVPTVEVNRDLELAGTMRTSAEHDEIMQERNWPFNLEIDLEGDGALYYFGSGHTRDPDDPQIEMIRGAWDAFEPTVALIESYAGFYIGGTRGGIKMFGEVGAVYALARAHDVPIYSLDPTMEAEARVLADEFGEREALMYYTLRVYCSERTEDMSRAEQEKLAAHLLRKRAERTGLGPVLNDIEDMDAQWAQSFAGLPDWRTLDPKEMWPGDVERSKLTAMANRSNRVRDEHQARVICELVQRGERVFAICGGSHVVMQEPVLRTTLGESASSAQGQTAQE